MYFEVTKSSFVHVTFIEACSSENSTKLKKQEDPSSSKFTKRLGSGSHTSLYDVAVPSEWRGKAT